jgi:hypothetical protein
MTALDTARMRNDVFHHVNCRLRWSLRYKSQNTCHFWLEQNLGSAVVGRRQSSFDELWASQTPGQPATIEDEAAAGAGQSSEI